jgi:hypothetical protein
LTLHPSVTLLHIRSILTGLAHQSHYIIAPFKFHKNRGNQISVLLHVRAIWSDLQNVAQHHSRGEPPLLLFSQTVGATHARAV